jgi:hypothetical protein
LTCDAFCFFKACHSHEKLHLEDLHARDMTKKLGEANAKLTEALTGGLCLFKSLKLLVYQALSY